jgi:undecaprenyldiphospho-muramoylpentapeptide beta-N-acetylglucosaminyltransferase
VSAPRGTVIAGGGTGGHTVPSMQIARALVARGHAPGSIELFGSRRGQEAALWPTLEFRYTLLPGRGIRRSLRPAALWANAGAVLGLVWACLRALASFARDRPRVVVMVGGYASFPAALAAVLTRTPLVGVTTDAVPGAVNGLLGRFAAANAVAFEGTDLPRAHVTGTPIRPDIAAAGVGRDRTGAREALGLPSQNETVTAVGGSLGARRVNRAVADLASRWTECPGRTIYHVTGRRDYEDFAGADGEGAGRTATGGTALSYKVVPFEDHMADLYAAADVCVSRAGAMSVAELTAAGCAAVLVPLPGAPRDHQTRNAEAMVRMGAAVLVPDAECDGRRLADELTALLGDPERLLAMRAAARTHGHPDAAARVAELVDRHAR